MGAGPTGVELAGQIRELATKTLRQEYRHINPEDARVLLFDGGKAPLAAFGRKLSAMAARGLTRLAYISRGRAVVSAFGVHIGGFAGRWAWLFIHIGFMTGYRNRVGAILSWWFAFTRDLRRARTFTMDDLPVAAGPYAAEPETGTTPVVPPQAQPAPAPPPVRPGS